MKHICTICLLLMACGCNLVKEERVVKEDYDKLFPSKEIEKPKNRRGELHVQICDPDQALQNYNYPGAETPADADQYRITVTCSFQEKELNGNLVSHIYSQYRVKYINEKKELVTIRCGTKNSGDSNPSSPNVMYNDKTFTVSFDVRSGFPLYLSVSGEGPRNSSIKASIKAVSADGLLEIPGLETEQYQIDEGMNPLKNPYCEYIILP